MLFRQVEELDENAYNRTDDAITKRKRKGVEAEENKDKGGMEMEMLLQIMNRMPLEEAGRRDGDKRQRGKNERLRVRRTNNASKCRD